jgi:hypothetical protein
MKLSEKKEINFKTWLFDLCTNRSQAHKSGPEFHTYILIV